MNSFTTIEYLKYKLRAQDRHGVHSPFVYSFNEGVLNKSGSIDQLVNNIIAYYSVKSAHTIDIPSANKLQPTGNTVSNKSAMGFDQLHIWDLTTNNNSAPPLHEIGSNDILIVKPLYTIPMNKQQWDALFNDDRVKLSIDLFHLGLLFFREEFIVKQHFTLKFKPA